MNNPMAHPPARLHLVSIGECLAELYRRDDGAFAPGYAGDAFNTLFYASRLGLRCGFVSALGDDLFTPMIADGIAAAGVDTALLAHIDGRRNGLYAIETDADGEYTFHFWRAGSAATQTLLVHGEAIRHYVRRADALLVTGVTLAVMEGADLLRDICASRDAGTRLVVDTNYRPRLWRSADEYRARLEPLIAIADVVLPSAADIRSAYGEASLDAVCSRFAERATVIVKDGPRGWGIAGADGIAWFAPETVAQSADTTGAGDAFNAGVLAGMASALPLEQCGRVGERTALAALAVRGAINHEFAPQWHATPPD